MTTLLQTKFTMPASKRSLVDRPRLIRRLDNVYHRKLVLISAPAGFGKTTLISTFVSQKRNTSDTIPIWLSLDEKDNDPARFSAYLAAALAASNFNLSLDETAVSTIPPDLFMTEVINSLSESLKSKTGCHLLIVLDDYHLIQNRTIHEAITFFLEHMPPNIHVILVSRADPPLPLARWRAHSQLSELRQEDLRFTPEEAVDFLNTIMSLSLTGDDIQTLNQRTEGWIAGLQMAAVSMQGRSDAANFVKNFGGSHRYILDYLMEEVLSSQSEEIKQFLLKTAVLERLCAPLCQNLMMTDLDCQTILEKLETANLFIIPLDDERRWYRYHRLFVDLLRQRLIQTDPKIVPQLHMQAAAWFEANDYLEEAIAHALLAKSFEKAAAMIEQMAEMILMRSEQVTFMRWLAQLPDSELAKRPSLSLYYACTLIMEGHTQAKVETVLQYVDAEDAPGEMALVHSLLAIYKGDGASAINLAQQALDQLDRHRSFLRSMAAWVLGLSYLFYGELERGWQALEESAQLSQQVGNMTIAVSSWVRLANQTWRQGDLFRAKRIYEQALVLATDEAERPLPIAGEPHIGLARIFYEWNDLETALQHVETGLILSERWREISGMVGVLWFARIKQALGDPETANAALERARQIAIKSKGTQFDDMAVAMTEAYLNLLQGNLQAVAAWCAERAIPDEIDPAALKIRDDIIEGHLRKYEYIILARLRLAQKHPEEALKLLLPLQAEAQRLQRYDLLIEIQILTALAYEQTANNAQADQHMKNALVLGEKGQFIRIFVDVGPDIAAVLRRQMSASEPSKHDSEHALPKLADGTKTYLQTLLAAFEDKNSTPPKQPLPAASQLIEPLSDREQEILALIANGLSNREIAEKLVLSLPTIKWHTSNIYGKLGVHNRTTAVVRARKLQILT